MVVGSQEHDTVNSLHTGLGTCILEQMAVVYAMLVKVSVHHFHGSKTTFTLLELSITSYVCLSVYRLTLSVCTISM
jgi:hypothetical protein